MKPPDPATPNAQFRLLQQQLILAQARLLELEDVRESLLTRVALLEQNLTDLQALADGKIAERDHLAGACAGLESQVAALRTRLEETIARLDEARAAATAHLGRAETTEAELAAVHRTLTWRWTRPLRRLAGLFRRSPG